jgi:hypothetical protein
MVGHMKTTIEISDPLLKQAKRVASRDGTTVRALAERGLRSVLREHQAKNAFKLRKASFRGEGFQKGVNARDWDRLREMVYQSRGLVRHARGA